MAKCKIRIDKSGMDEFLNSAEIVSILEEEANTVLGRLGDGYEVQQPAWNGPHRANVAIATTTKRTYWDNIKNNTMLKACRSKK